MFAKKNNNNNKTNQGERGRYGLLIDTVSFILISMKNYLNVIFDVVFTNSVYSVSFPCALLDDFQPHSPSTELRLVLEEVRESAQEHHETAKIQEEITQELQNMVMKQCNQVKDLMEGTRQLQAEIQTEREQNKLLKYQIQTDNQEYQELLTKQQKLREKIIEYQQRLYDMNRENVALKRELDDNDTKGNAELENLQKQLESFKSENNQLQRQIDRIQSSNSHLLHQTQSLINENFQLKTMITQLERDLKEERRKRRDTGKLPRLPPSYYNQKPFKL